MQALATFFYFIKLTFGLNTCLEYHKETVPAPLKRPCCLILGPSVVYKMRDEVR